MNNTRVEKYRKYRDEIYSMSISKARYEEHAEDIEKEKDSREVIKIVKEERPLSQSEIIQRNKLIKTIVIASTIALIIVALVVALIIILIKG